MEIVNIIILVSSFISAVTAICAFVKKMIDKGFEPIYKKMDKLDINACKNYLSEFLADVEHGVEKDEVQKQRAYEVYAHYTVDLKQNSYIHDKWEKLMK